MVYDNAFENDIPSDLLEALADLACEQREAMMECNPSDFYTSNYELNTEPTT